MRSKRVDNVTEEMNCPVCLFVASSDNTRDVFRNVMASYEKYWKNCRYREFVGLNGNDDEIARRFVIVTAEMKGWRSELLVQIEALPPEISHVLLMLDDFLLHSPVDEERLDSLIRDAITMNADYTRLVPLSSALLFQLFRRLKNSLQGDEFESIRQGEAYYSSLQPALWKRSHLVAMLRLPGSIWDFENQAIPGARHFAITHAPPIPCRHVVEKGEWMADAAQLFRKLALPFYPGNRPHRPASEIPLLWFRRVKFALVGYAGLRVRNLLAHVTSRVDNSGSNDRSH